MDAVSAPENPWAIEYEPQRSQHREALPRTAPAREHPCQLVSYHAPEVVITEFHHSKPVYLQNRLYGRIMHGADLWVCSNCHEAIHAWLYWLLGERRKPDRMGRAAKAEAERTYIWYMDEMAAKTEREMT